MLDPAIADLQHDYAGATDSGRRVRALVGGYAAFWQSLVWCCARDVFARDAREFHARAAVAFVVAVAVAAAIEALLMHTSVTSRRYVLMHFLDVGSSARTDTATLRFGIPLAMFPAVLYAARRTARVTLAAALRTIALGTMLTVIASGWVAPSLERWRLLQQRSAFVSATNGRYALSPIEWQLDRYPFAKTSDDLVRGAVAPPRHRFPGYPTYVAPEDRDLDRLHRIVIYDRLLLVVLGVLCGLLGWMAARWRARPSQGGEGPFDETFVPTT